MCATLGIVSERRFPEFKSFGDFWPYYVGEHKRPGCRALHYLGVLVSLAIAACAIWSASWMMLAVAIVAGYALAWTGHFFVEHNTPATWGYVRWSFLAEFKMFALALTGRMGKEIERLDGEGAAGVDPDSTPGEG